MSDKFDHAKFRAASENSIFLEQCCSMSPTQHALFHSIFDKAFDLSTINQLRTIFGIAFLVEQRTCTPTDIHDAFWLAQGRGLLAAFIETIAHSLNTNSKTTVVQQLLADMVLILDEFNFGREVPTPSSHFKEPKA